MHVQLEAKSQETKDSIASNEKRIAELEKDVADKNDEIEAQLTKIQQSEALYKQLQTDFEMVKNSLLKIFRMILQEYKSHFKNQKKYRNLDIIIVFDLHPLKGPVNIYWGVGTGAFLTFSVKNVYILS